MSVVGSPFSNLGIREGVNCWMLRQLSDLFLFLFSLKKKITLQQTNIQDEGNRRGSYGLLRTLTSLFVANFLFFFLAAAGSLQDLSSLTRDQTWATCSGSAES